MSTFLLKVGDQMLAMFSDTQAAESVVAAGFAIFKLCPSERNSSVAHDSVAPVGALPIVQKDGNWESNPVMSSRLAGCANVDRLAIHRRHASPARIVRNRITNLPD